MSICFQYCLSCTSVQEYKINLIQIHGICRNHYPQIREVQKCLHCECIIPIVTISKLVNPQKVPVKNAKIINQPHLIPTSHSQQMSPTNLPPKCDYCNEHSVISYAPCHNICKDCSKSKCPICDIKETPVIPCINCQTKIETTKLDCGHQVCKDCSANGCELCHLFNSSNVTINEIPVKADLRPNIPLTSTNEPQKSSNNPLSESLTWERESYCSSYIPLSSSIAKQNLISRKSSNAKDSNFSSCSCRPCNLF